MLCTYKMSFELSLKKYPMYSKVHTLFYWISEYVYKNLFSNINYSISSYKTLPRKIPAFLIMPTPGTLSCRWNLVISNKSRSWGLNEKIIPIGLISGHTVYWMLNMNKCLEQPKFYLFIPESFKLQQADALGWKWKKIIDFSAKIISGNTV